MKKIILILVGLFIIANVIAIDEVLNTVEDSKIIIDISELNDDKFNDATKEYLDNVKDKDEKKNYLVKYKDNPDKYLYKNKYEKVKVFKIEVNIDEINDMIDDFNIEYIELDQQTSILSDEVTYNINKTNAQNVWSISKGSGVSIGVLDTGVSEHDDLDIYQRISVIDDDGIDYNGHGTSVIGVINAQHDDEGIAGIAPDADLYSIKIMNGSIGSLSDAISGIEWCIDNEIDIISMSFGTESYSQILKEVLENAYDDGALLISAAGNDHDDVSYPAAYTSVIAVGATDDNDDIASFSNYGATLELVAPGVDIYSTSLSGYDYFDGTSLSAPHVAGIAALIKSYNNTLSNEEIRGKLQNDAIDLGETEKDDYYGYGLVYVNFNSSNYNYTEDEYFYEVFNITGNDTFFCLNGTGTIDDVDFSEGYYLIKKYIDDETLVDRIYVDDNGNVHVLIPGNEWEDDFFFDGTDADGIAWEDEDLWFRYYSDTEIYYADVICYDIDYSPPDYNYWKCWGDDPTKLSQCMASFSELDDFCDGNSDCDAYWFHSWHQIDDSELSIDESRILKVRGYYDCDNSNGNFDEANSVHTYYIIDAKKSKCETTTSYTIMGHYDSEYIDIETFSCPTNYECDEAIVGYSSYTENYDYSTGANYPCRIADGQSCTLDSDCLTGHYCTCEGTCNSVDVTCVDYCNGTIEVNTEDNAGYGLYGLSVYVDDSFNGSTDFIGQYIVELEDIECDTDFEVKVTCSDNTTLCDIKTTQIDFNGDTDYLFYDCTKCSSNNDLYIFQDDIFVDVENKIVKTEVHSTGITSTILVTLIRVDDEGIKQEEKSKIVNINAGTEINATFTLTGLEDTDYLHIYVDSGNAVSNEDESNNYIFRAAMKDIKAYVDVDIDPTLSLLEDDIEDYIGSFVEIVSSPSAAHVIIIVGHPLFSNSEPFNIGNKIINGNGGSISKPYGGIVKAGDNFDNEYLQYNKPNILVYGNRIEGTIAAVKRMINAHEIILDPLHYYCQPPNCDGFPNDITYYIDDYDTLGISVMDLMHTSESHFYEPNAGFEDTVRKILFDNNFEVSVKTVKTTNDNTTLRMKHINSDFSAMYRDFISDNDDPVVLAHGIHSDLFTWEDFAYKMAWNPNDPREVWLIEMYGGPTTEDCDYGCPNYTISDLQHYYWPALIAGVQEYSGKTNLSYVGYDLGCTIALESLENYSVGKNNAGYYFDYDTGNWLYSDLSAESIKTFIGVGCIGNFSKSDYFTTSTLAPFADWLNSSRNNYLQDSELFEKYDGHLPSSYYKSNDFIGFTSLSGTENTLTLFGYLFKFVGYDISLIAEMISWVLSNSIPAPTNYDGSISMNVISDIIDMMNESNNNLIGEDVDIDNLLVIQGFNTWNANNDNAIQDNIEIEGTDNFVSHKDQQYICQNINSNNKYYISYEGLNHFTTKFSRGLDMKLKVKTIIIDFLSNKEIDLSSEHYIVVSNQSSCE